jgi:hypothetical protein
MLFASCLLFRCLTTGGAIGFVCLSASCAPAPPPPASGAVVGGPIVVGQVAVVKQAQHFVLIDLGSDLSVPAPGAALRSVSDERETAHLRAAREQKPPFIAAEIIDGHPAVGDEVVR